jgi:class 3 adenylate cyclase
VTFLLTDIVESSALWETNPVGMSAALERHDGLVEEMARAHDGTLLKSKLEGDATVSVFPRVSAGAQAALALRDALLAEDWPEGIAPAVRIALHTGEAVERSGDYFGPALNRAARLRSLAGGGQIVVSYATTSPMAPSYAASANTSCGDCPGESTCSSWRPWGQLRSSWAARLRAILATSTGRPCRPS